MYVYIDESGDTGYTKKSTRHFILTAVMVDDPFVLRRIAKDVHKGKRDKKKGNILHAHSETNQTKDKLADILMGTKINCFVVVLKKTEQMVSDVYLSALKNMANHLKFSHLKSVVIARKDTRKYYNQSVTDSIMKDYNIKIIFSDMLSEKALQIADFYSWCIFAHLENDNSYYFLKLSRQITFI